MRKEEAISLSFNHVMSKFSELNLIHEKEFMLTHKFLEIHCIELIGKKQDANVTKLSKAMHLTRGAVSKTVKRLIERGNIEVYRKPENKKEIYYRLTDSGKALFESHEEMHHKRIARGCSTFSILNDGEGDFLINILQKIDSRLADQLKQVEVNESGAEDDAASEQ